MIKKKDVRILYNMDKDTHIITDLILEEFSENYKPYHLNKQYRFDIGNANFVDWPHWVFSDVLMHLFVQNECKDKKSVIKQLLKVEEWKEDLEWIKEYWNL